MKVALVYDRVNKFGGAERVLLALHEIYPQAPLYTAVYDSKGAPWAKDFQVIPSFLQKIPFARRHHEIFPWLTPLAFESFNLDSFDIVISVTSAEAKGVITKPSTSHLCYCLTPTRYLWSDHHLYLSRLRYGFLNSVVRALIRPALAYLRGWDRVACQRVDQYFSISQNIARRIKKYYGRDSAVIYPPVETVFFRPAKPQKKGKYFLVVSRLVAYKRIEIAIKCFNRLGLPLVIIGDGLERRFLERMAARNIKFLGQNLTDRQVLRYYQNCRALIFPGEEDFGLVSLEAQACGKPVIAFKGGGIPETLVEGKTGVFFKPQTSRALEAAVLGFDERRYNQRVCRESALRFGKVAFKKRFKEKIERIWEEHQKNL